MLCMTGDHEARVETKLIHEPCPRKEKSTSKKIVSSLAAAATNSCPIQRRASLTCDCWDLLESLEWTQIQLISAKWHRVRKQSFVESPLGAHWSDLWTQWMPIDTSAKDCHWNMERDVIWSNFRLKTSWLWRKWAGLLYVYSDHGCHSRRWRPPWSTKREIWWGADRSLQINKPFWRQWLHNDTREDC